MLNLLLYKWQNYQIIIPCPSRVLLCPTLSIYKKGRIRENSLFHVGGQFFSIRSSCGLEILIIYCHYQLLQYCYKSSNWDSEAIFWSISVMRKNWIGQGWRKVLFSLGKSYIPVIPKNNFLKMIICFLSVSNTVLSYTFSHQHWD